MRAVAFCGLLSLTLFSSAALRLKAADVPVAGRSPVTILLQFEKPHSDVSLNAMRQELGGILAGAGVRVDVQLRDELSGNPEFGDLVVFKMKGSCTMEALPVGALSDERGPLAMTYSSDGQLLPFGEVDCDHVRHSVQRVLGNGDPQKHQFQYGIALARVMAHEMYHMMANSQEHTKQGVTKESLSARELVQGKLEFPGDVDQAFRTPTHPGKSH